MITKLEKTVIKLAIHVYSFSFEKFIVLSLKKVEFMEIILITTK